MTLITVREFATLTTVPGLSSLDRATITASDFTWLAALTSATGERSRLVRQEGPRTLKVLNHVGVIRTPSGQEIEILPKVSQAPQDLARARRLLLRMIAHAVGAPPQTAPVADLTVLKRPFTEWMALTFCQGVAQLIQRGLRGDYRRIEGQERYLRGRLDLPRQLRASPAQAVQFHIQHDVFQFDRPENRLIRAAIDKIARQARAPETWRLARELALRLEEIPPSRAIAQDLARWSEDRLMAHYAPLRGLCALILTGQTPFAVSGAQPAESMLFPMERLFEDWVARSLQGALPAGWRLLRQPRTHALGRYEDQDWFDLRPDFVAKGPDRVLVLDAKWKRLTADRSARHGISQADLYQMSAYGQTYLKGSGDLFLIYPKGEDFPHLSGPLQLKPDLRLHIVGLDVDSGQLSNGVLREASAR